MKPVSKIITASAAALSTFVFFAIVGPAAHAGEFCKTDISGMRGCGFSTLEQCQATVSGTTGTCARDPFYQEAKNAQAYQPKHKNSRRELHPTKKPAEY